MIQRFVDLFMAAKPQMLAALGEKHPEDYDDLVRRVVATCANTEDWRSPDPERITVIDHGEYQGTRLYIIGGSGYQPSEYWSIFVDYGSCSGCDTFEAIKSYTDDPPTPEQVNDYWTLMLHMVQSMRRLSHGEPEEAR